MPERRDQTPQPVPGELRADRVLDVAGLFCPVPIIRTAEAVREMRAGEVLEILSDDRVILIDLPAWCLSRGHGYLGARADGELLHLFIRKGPPAGAAPPGGPARGPGHEP